MILSHQSGGWGRGVDDVIDTLDANNGFNVHVLVQTLIYHLFFWSSFATMVDACKFSLDVLRLGVHSAFITFMDTFHNNL
jgi:hypothetical protein